jgi:hypothetical protein
MIRPAIVTALLGMRSRLDVESSVRYDICSGKIAGAILAGPAIAPLTFEKGAGKAYAEDPAPR